MTRQKGIQVKVQETKKFKNRKNKGEKAMSRGVEYENHTMDEQNEP